MKTKLAAICLSLILSAQAQLALAQSSQLSSDQAWNLVKETKLGEKLELKLKDGKKVKGVMILASDSDLSLALKNQRATLFKRDEIQQVWRHLPHDSEMRKILGGVGAGVGLISGIAIAAAAARSTGPCGDCTGESVGLIAIVVGMTTAGASIGRRLAGGGKRIMIYQAP